jgi:hypothetical protein
VEEFSGLTISNRLVEAADLRVAMAGRKAYSVNDLAAHDQAKFDEGGRNGVSWVTIAVVAEKQPTKLTKEGRKFSIWQLRYG